MVSVLTPIATEIFFILSFKNAVKQNKKNCSEKRENGQQESATLSFQIRRN
jgi:hypothetical protein